jgi:hypothetical protein
MTLQRRRRAVFVTMALFVTVQAAAALSSSPLDYHTFINGSALWLVDPSGIQLFRSDTRSVSPIRLSDTAASDSILDIAENSSVLWVLAQSGVYDIDLTTLTVERLPGNKVPRGAGRLTVDDDYLWVGFDDTLWRFDKLGREWLPYKMNSAVGNDLRGMYSSGTNVFCVQSTSVKIFSMQDEKWLRFPYKKGMVISSAAQYWIDKATMVFVDGQNIYRYLTATETWDILNCSSPLVDMVSQDTALFYQTSAGVFKYSTATSVTLPFEIPHPGDVRCFAPFSSDTVFCPTDNNILKYAISSKTTDYVLAPQGVADYHPCKAIMIGGTFTLVTPKAISSYNTATQSWENTLLGSGGNNRQVATWDDNGARINYGGGCSSQLKGSIQKEYYIDSIVSRNDTTYLDYDNKFPVAGLTLHNTFGKGRYFDAFFDNTNTSQLPSKGLFYRGADSDVVEEARLGTNTYANTNILSQTLPTMQFEGGSAVLQSPASLATRDRKIVKVQAGIGSQTTRSVSNVLTYNEGGLYTIPLPLPSDTPKTIIVPGSMQITIDGVAVDSSNFTLVAQTGSLVFNPSVPIDPSSVIRVTYQLQVVPHVLTPELYQQVQGVPKSFVQNVGYASVTVSPTDWISPQVGVYALNTDTTHTTLINAALPLEFRTASQSMFFKLNPELSLDEASMKKAEGLALQSRFGPQLSLLGNALVQDSGFATTNNTSRGYGDLLHNYNMTATYDITKELPVSYIGQDIASINGLEQLNEVTAGAHFLGLPFCDITLVRSVVNAKTQQSGAQIQTDTTIDTISGVIDTQYKLDTIPADTLSLQRTKDKVTVNLYETSSPFVESLLHINRLTYNLSWTGFTSQSHDTAGRGGFFYGTATICPTKRISISGNGTFLNNPIGSQFGRDYSPTLTLQTIDAPPGIDISASNYIHYQSFMDSSASTSLIVRSASMTIKPGSWVSWMSWISPIVGLSQTLNCNFDEAMPGAGDFLYGGDVVQNTLTKDAGANIFPTNNITWRNDNQFTTADSSTTYYSFNDLKWWFTSKQLWQTHWEYTHTLPRYGSGDSSSKTLDYQHGFTKYTNNWNSWLQTMTGIDAMYMVHDTGSSLETGPDISVNITKQKTLCFRSLLVDQTVTFYAVKNDNAWEQGPAISYELYLKAVILPNISLSATNSFTFGGGAFQKYSGDIVAALIF